MLPRGSAQPVAAAGASPDAPTVARRGLRGPVSRILLLVLAGCAQALSFAPGPLPAWSLPFVQILSLAVLAGVTLQAQRARQAAWWAWWFGLGQFTLGVYWLVISLHRFGGLAWILAVGALLLFAAAMALYGALACALSLWLLAGRAHREQAVGAQWRIAAVWASAWAGMEWLRGTLFTGFTWLQGGYAHAEGMFAAWVPLVGVYGAGWLAAFAAVAVALMLRARHSPPWDRSAAAVLGISLATGLAGIALGYVQWGADHGAPLLLRLVQPATPQSEKFDPDRFLQAQAFAQALAATPPKSATDRPDLVLLPETMLTQFQDQVPADVWQAWQQVAVSAQAPLALGLPLYWRDTDGSPRITNSMLALDAAGDVVHQEGQPWHYDKRHLVPFGEFVPTGFRWFVRALQIPLGDFDRGVAHQPPLRVGGQALAFNICYEDTFGEEIAAAMLPSPAQPEGAHILVNVANLAWFGDSWALRQHLQMARLRTLETARPMVRATNTGMTAAIGPQGQVYGQLAIDVPGILDVEVQGRTGLTPYVRARNMPVVAGSLLILLWALLGRRRGRRQAPAT